MDNSKIIEESPIIKLPEDKGRIKKLELKLSEYFGRVARLRDRLTEEHYNWHPGQIQLFYKSSLDYHKLIILGNLFDRREIDPYELSQRMYEEMGDSFNLNNFNMACGVIDDYCLTGGANVQGSSGF